MNLQFIGGLLSLALLLAGGWESAPPNPQPPAYTEETEEESAMPRLTIGIGDQTFSARLYDSDTTRALLERLPLTLSMEELHGNEKYCYLDEPLPTHAALPDGIRAGELMLYGSDCLVLFYESFPTSYRYTPLGRMENPEGLAEALGGGSVTVRFAVESISPESGD